MRLIKRLAQTVTLSLGSLLVAFAVPLSVFADTATPPDTSSAAVTNDASAPAPVSPAPAASVEPAQPAAAQTTQATPAVEPEKTYTYDEDTQRWNTDAWVYNASSGKYEPAPVPVTALPQMEVVAPAATNDNNSATSTSGDKVAIDNETAAALANILDSGAFSGDSAVLRNTIGGDAASGNATATATVINNVNSSMTNSNNKQAASFVTDVMGDVNGDIILQPMLLKAMLEAGSSAEDSSKNINSVTSNGITNDINLTAQSGDATVSQNGQAGNATTGSANTVADVVNIVNSMVAANQSFIGTVNIYGSLNGDILIAPDFIPQLLASNASGTTGGSGATQLTSADTQTIVNNIALAAESGQALVDKNTQAGSATSGDAQTNTVIFNLTGHQIIASNSLLVFVNVLGRWVGVIVDAPVGATAAALGSGVIDHSVSPNLVIDAASTTQITNNINLASQSGNASVTGNTFAGNATSGNATASANIANISNSQVGLSGWFGILFINVFGDWVGSLGIDTDAGNRAVAVVQQDQAMSLGSGESQVQPEPVRVMSFVPRTPFSKPASIKVVQGGSVDTVNNLTSPDAQLVKAGASKQNRELGVSDIPSSQANIAQVAETAVKTPQLSIPIALSALAVAGLSLYGLRKLW